MYGRKRSTSRMLTQSSNSTVFFDPCLDTLQQKKVSFFVFNLFIPLWGREEQETSASTTTAALSFLKSF